MESRQKIHQGSIGEVYRVAWPIVISMLSYTAMGVTDTLFVGWIGKTELAAVGLATTAVFFINSFFLGLLHSVKVLTAQATGAQRHDDGITAAWHGVYLAIPLGIFVGSLGLVDEWLLSAFGAPRAVLEGAKIYFAIRLLAAPMWYIVISLSDYYQGIGDTRTPMKINLVVNGLNIVLDAVLIFGVGPIEPMGIAGAAWATVIACAVGTVLFSAVFLRDVGRPIALDRSALRSLCRIGVPMGVRYTLGVGGFTVFTAIVARMGEDELAANQIAFKILSLSFLPGYGISEAATVLTGQYVGAGDSRNVHRAFRSSLTLSVGFMGVLGVLFWVLPEPFIRVFNEDQAIVAAGAQLLAIAAVFQVFDAVAMTASGALNGAGDTRFTMFASIFSTWCVLVPFSYFFAVVLQMGLPGAWMGMTVEIISLAVILTYRFKTEGWRAQQVSI